MANPNPKEAWAARRDPVVQRFLKKLIRLRVGQSFCTSAPSSGALYARAARARRGRKECAGRRFQFMEIPTATGTSTGRFTVRRVK